MTYHGARSVLQRSSTARYASMYAGHFARSSTSPGLYFQCLVGSSSRAISRSFYSAEDMLRKHLINTMPLSTKSPSQALISV
jgi:hypothetical protein